MSIGSIGRVHFSRSMWQIILGFFYIYEYIHVHVYVYPCILLSTYSSLSGTVLGPEDTARNK